MLNIKHIFDILNIEYIKIMFIRIIIMFPIYAKSSIYNLNWPPYLTIYDSNRRH